MYPILDRMEAAGWLESVEEPSETKGRPPRRSYRFTPVGLDEAKKALLA